MGYKELFNKMLKCRMISDDWRNMLDILAAEIRYSDASDETAVENRVMELLVLYASLMDDGNVYMSLDEEQLRTKVEDKISKLKVQYEEDEDEAGAALDEIKDELREAYGSLAEIQRLSIVGKDSFFIIENNSIYTRKHFNAVKSISESVKRLFKNNSISTTGFSYKKYAAPEYNLSSGQEEVLRKGYYNNLLITGGPGTGKTTSIYWLLLSLLAGNDDKNADKKEIYLAAPSGKAASRMADSIKECADKISDDSIAEINETIKNLNGKTIHTLLGFNKSNGGFIHNKNNRFEENSIFVIDEASMIDVCIFAALLEAIPDGARIFILGDKDQLPPVACGAVFGNLLAILTEGNIVALTESKRFSEHSEIYKLADAVNTGTELPINIEDWEDYHYLIKEELLQEEHLPEEMIKDETGKDTKGAGKTAASKAVKTIHYISDEVKDNAEMITSITDAWYSKYYKKLQQMCYELDSDDIDSFRRIFSESEKSKILCANNKGIRGVSSINRNIIKKWFDPAKRIAGYYPGELLIITRNLKKLDLNNGESGVAVKFKDDDMLYIMFNKHSSLNADEGKQHRDKIFKVEDFVFYPASKIDREDISSAFAITIHKSQGSDYGNILVILPRLKGNLLLNRQLLYTAITRTKGKTYILSNRTNLDYAKESALLRDTGITLSVTGDGSA